MWPTRRRRLLLPLLPFQKQFLAWGIEQVGQGGVISAGVTDIF